MDEKVKVGGSVTGAKQNEASNREEDSTSQNADGTRQTTDSKRVCEV